MSDNTRFTVSAVVCPNCIKYIVECLINHGADVNKAAKQWPDEGKTPLYIVSKKEYFAVVEYLVTHETMIDDENEDRRSEDKIEREKKKRRRMPRRIHIASKALHLSLSR